MNLCPIFPIFDHKLSFIKLFRQLCVIIILIIMYFPFFSNFREFFEIMSIELYFDLITLKLSFQFSAGFFELFMLLIISCQTHFDFFNFFLEINIILQILNNQRFELINLHCRIYL